MIVDIDLSFVSRCVASYAAGVYRDDIGHSGVTSASAEGGSTGMVVVNIPIIAFYFTDSATNDIFVSCDICLDDGCAPVSISGRFQLADISRTLTLTREITNIVYGIIIHFPGHRAHLSK